MPNTPCVSHCLWLGVSLFSSVFLTDFFSQPANAQAAAFSDEYSTGGYYSSVSGNTSPKVGKSRSRHEGQRQKIQLVGRAGGRPAHLARFSPAATTGDIFTSYGLEDRFTSRPIGPDQRIPYFNADDNYSSFPESTDLNRTFNTSEEDPSMYTVSDDPRDVFASAPPSNKRLRYGPYTVPIKDFKFSTNKKNETAARALDTSEESEPPFLVEDESDFYQGSDATFISGYYEGNTGSQCTIEVRHGAPEPCAYYRDSFGHTSELYGWPVKRQPLRVYFAGDVGDARDGLVKRVFLECLNEWCRATKGTLKYSITNDFKNAEIILCREFTSNHELAENMPKFYNAWLEQVKVRLLDSTCDTLDEPRLRAVLLHSAGHALGYFEHSHASDSVMNEFCAHKAKPIQKLCSKEMQFIRLMYESYRDCHKRELQAPIASVKTTKPAISAKSDKDKCGKAIESVSLRIAPPKAVPTFKHQTNPILAKRS